MADIGVQMMMLKDQVAELGMYPVLEKLKALNIASVEISQIPMNEENIAALERGISDLGIKVGALSVAYGRKHPGLSVDSLEDDFDKIVADCKRLGVKYTRIGMVPLKAMISRETTEAWAAEVEPYAARLAAEGITLCYHNHHIDLHKFGNERIFDIIRRVAPSLHFEVDLHWVQRGGMAPLDMLKEYAGVCKLIHVKDFRIAGFNQETIDLLKADQSVDVYGIFNNVIEFAEVGQGNMNWPALLPASQAAGAEYFFIEQDMTYGRDPFDCIKDSREYLASIGW